MKKLEALIQSLRGFDKNAEQLAIAVTKNHQPTITGLNKEQLNAQGIRSDSTQITPPYTRNTIKIKQAKGQTTAYVTLRDKGDFQGDFQIVYQPDHFMLVSTDSKAKKLIAKYGATIMGLTEENIKVLADVIKDDYINLFYKTILE